jgi:lipopolysaccharide transport system ATP-binding protein
VLIELDGVGVAYRRRGLFRSAPPFWALEDVSFTLSEGECLGVIGRNGAGKSSLLKLLAGLILPDRGSLRNHGVKVGMLSLQLGFVPNLTGRENATLSALMLGLTRQRIAGLLEEIREFSELGDFFDQPLGVYSTGMRARLGFSVAIYANPRVLLIDEVLSVGDANFAAKSRAVLLQRIRVRQTVVIVSHNTQQLRAICNRGVLLEGGRSRVVGPIDEVIRSYEGSNR